MNVSQFELIFKPQSPVPPAEIVLQGYFLSISNLEDVALSFRLRFTTSSISDPTRTLANNTVVIVDTGDVNNDFNYTLNGAPTSKSFSIAPLVTIPAHATAKIAVLPRDPFPAPIGDGTADPADYEARGYVGLELPALFQRVGSFFRLQSQLDRNARVMLTAQNRATYFQDGAIKDQTQASVPLASGAALTEIEPAPPFFRPLPGFDLNPLAELERPFAMIDPSEMPQRLAELMAAAAAADMDTRAFNAVLRDAGVGMALERRRVTQAAPPVAEDA